MMPVADGSRVKHEIHVSTLSVRDELGRSYQRSVRRRIAHWTLAVLVLLLLLTTGLWIWFRGQYGTFAWWSAPPRIPYCGLNFVPAPDGYQSFVNRSSLGRLDEVAAVPPLFRAVFQAPEAFPIQGNGLGSSQSCSDTLFFQTGSGKLIEYIYPTA
jgi:hypothetical protein